LDDGALVQLNANTEITGRAAYPDTCLKGALNRMRMTAATVTVDEDSYFSQHIVNITYTICSLGC